MKLAELKTFLAIVETGSLARASDVLHVTQSTVTARLQALESALGQPLIRRQKSGAVLTPAGERLRGYAQTIVDLWRQARQETALPDGASVICNIVTEPALWPNLGQRFFDHLRLVAPDVVVSVWQGSQTEVAGWLDSGKADVAFTHGAGGARQDHRALPADQLILVSDRPGSPVRGDPGYVFVEGGDAFYRDHAVAYADTGSARLSFGDACQGLAHLLNEGGSAYLPARMVRADVEAGRLHRLDAPVFVRPVNLVTNRAAAADWPWFGACVNALYVQDTGPIVAQ